MTVAADHPAWVRSCGDCERFLFGMNGEVSTTEERQGGTVVELPVARPPGVPPPCGVCPKLAGVERKVPLPPADDFDGLYADVRDWWRGRRAVGGVTPAGPFLTAAATLFDRHDRAADRRRLAADLLDALLALRSR